MRSTVSATQPQRSGGSSRLHYLDWLRVAATLGVFLFHAVHPFDLIEWAIKNAEQSMIVTLFILLLAPWGMPFFFLMSGTGSWFSLRRRTARQYAIERVTRLLVPFVVGSILLTPIQVYLELVHKGQYRGPFLSLGFIPALVNSRAGPGLDELLNPQAFRSWGLHLWFLGFLFCFSLVALPLFLWLKGETGQRFIKSLAHLSERRGGILLFILPLLVVQLLLRPLYLEEHDWVDFVFMLVFFVYGYILIADERFARGIRRDWVLTLIGGLITTLFFYVALAAEVGLVWMVTPSLPGFYLFWGMWSVNSWCWSILMLHVGMRFLDFTNRWLQYGQEAIVPFYVFHGPVIIAIAFYVVQWQASILVKLLVVVLSSFAMTLGLYELIVRRVGPLRVLFGMKPTDSEVSPVASG